MVTNEDIPMDEVVIEWGFEYASAMRKSIRSGAIRTIDPGLNANDCTDGCTDIRRVLATVLDVVLQMTEVPLMEWHPYIGAFLRPFINDVMHTRYNSTKNGAASLPLSRP